MEEQKVVDNNVSPNKDSTKNNATNFNDFASNSKKIINFETTPVVDIVNYILVTASKKNTSDIHFDPAENHMKVRFRIDGKLDTFTIVPNTAKQNLIARLKIMAGMNITETRLPQDGAIRTVIEDVSLDMRVSSLPTKRGEKMVIRIMDYSMSLKGLESLCFNDINYKKVLKMISEPNGIILVTGATGSGKSTTVYSLLQRLNQPDTNIITVTSYDEFRANLINNTMCALTDNEGNYTDTRGTDGSCSGFVCKVTLNGKEYTRDCKSK